MILYRVFRYWVLGIWVFRVDFLRFFVGCFGDAAMSSCVPTAQDGLDGYTRPGGILIRDGKFWLGSSNKPNIGS